MCGQRLFIRAADCTNCVKLFKNDDRLVKECLNACVSDCFNMSWSLLNDCAVALDKIPWHVKEPCSFFQTCTRHYSQHCVPHCINMWLHDSKCCCWQHHSACCSTLSCVACQLSLASGYNANVGLNKNLVDPASSHMLVSKIKPCMSQYKLQHGKTVNGSLKQL